MRGTSAGSTNSHQDGVRIDREHEPSERPLNGCGADAEEPVARASSCDRSARRGRSPRAGIAASRRLAAARRTARRGRGRGRGQRELGQHDSHRRSRDRHDGLGEPPSGEAVQPELGGASRAGVFHVEAQQGLVERERARSSRHRDPDRRLDDVARRRCRRHRRPRGLPRLHQVAVVTTANPRWRPVSGNDPVLRPTAGATAPSLPPPP